MKGKKTKKVKIEEGKGDSTSSNGDPLVIDLTSDDDSKDQTFNRLNQINLSQKRKREEEIVNSMDYKTDSVKIVKKAKYSVTEDSARTEGEHLPVKFLLTFICDGEETLKDISAFFDVPREVKQPCQLSLKWRKLKDSTLKNPPSPSIESLLDMVGLSSIKEEFLKLYRKITMAQKEQKMPLDGFNFNTLFVGNPGTGKTTVAKLFASFLTEVGMFDFDCQVIMKTGSELRNDGVDGLEEILSELRDEGGGVIFIDEAYQLNDEQGRPIIDCILGNSEKMTGKFGKLIWILAGDKKQMEDFLKVNIGLTSRFPSTFKFEDYTDSELEEILTDFFTRGGQDVSVKKALKDPSSPLPTPSLSLSTPYAPLNPVVPVAAPLNRRQKSARKTSSASARTGKLKAANALNNPNPTLTMNPNRPDEVDQWGNTWKWDSQRSVFTDAYGNTCRHGTNNLTAVLGSMWNPVTTKAGQTLLYHFFFHYWYDMTTSSRINETYPGKSEQPSSTVQAKQLEQPEIEPFLVSHSKWLRISARRIGRGRGVEGFGNARTVRTFFQKAHDRQVKRIDEMRQQGFHPSVRMFVRDDLLGPKASRENLETSVAWKELQAMEGLKTVKESMDQLLQIVITNGEREEEEKELLELVLNRVFLGNPGTGKTTVAHLYGRILADVGILSKGEVVFKTASDFVGSALGKSEEITRGILEQSKGCVLVIDEAYGLFSAAGSAHKKNEPYREAVINTLVEQIQGSPGEDRAVLMLGYRKEMEEMFANANPGLSRRFQLEDAFVFEDYDDEALLRILIKAVKQQDMKINKDTALFAIKQLEKARARPHFGNAGAVNNLLSNAKIRMQQRLKALRVSPIDKDLLIQDDFKYKNFCEKPLTTNELLADVIGCEEIRKKLKKTCAVVEYQRKNGEDPRESASFNYLFLGAPGTGKTTIARKMGLMFHSLGLIPFDEVIETTASKFQTGYMGHAALKTRELFESAKGKVLFIDEAYQLNPGKGHNYMQEVVDEMVQCMTSEEFKNKLIIILAGYEKEVKEMLFVNQGLQSRFTECYYFHDLNEEEIIEMIQKKFTKVNTRAKISKEASDYLPTLAKQLKEISGFSNGRDVETLVMKLNECFIERYMEDLQDGDDEEPLEELLSVDMRKAMKELSDQRKKPHDNYLWRNNRDLNDSLPSMKQLPPPLPVIATITATEHKEEMKKQTINLIDSDDSDIDGDGDGNGDESDDKIEEKDWDDLHPLVRNTIQVIFNEKGWLENENMRSLLVRANRSTSIVKSLLSEIETRLSGSICIGEIEKMWDIWQRNQKKVNKAKDKQKHKKSEAKKSGKKKSLVPIWRCGVCGRANEPYIACYVAPFIVRYEERDI
eukprot:gene2068-2204_t